MSITVPRNDGKQLFKVVAVSVCGKGVRVEDEYGVQFDAQRVHKFLDGNLVLEVGDIISALSSGDDLRDVFVERGAKPSEWKERSEFDGAGPEGPGWEYKIATGEGFVKR